MLVWIHAASDNRWGDGRRRVPIECLRTAYVCEELRHAGFEDLSTMEGWRGCLCGLALMQPRADPSSVTDLLTGPLRAINDWMLATRFSNLPRASVDVPRAVLFEQPVRVHVRGAAPTVLFNIVTPFSLQLLAAQQCRAPGAQAAQVARDAAANWLRQCRLGVEFEDCCVMATMPLEHAEHALLFASGRWTGWAVPLSQGREGRSPGLNYVPAWVPRGVLQPDAGAEPPEFAWTPAMMQVCANRLRELHAMSPSNDLRALIEAMQHARDAQLLHAALRSRKAYAMDHLVSCVLGASLLKNAAHFLDMLQHGIRAVTQQPDLARHLLDRLATPSVVPSPTTLRRHRLTLHMALCAMQQDSHEELMRQPGGVVTWRTVDSSPQYGWDWVLNGMRLISAGSLEEAFADANALCSPALDDEDAARLLQKLVPLVQWRQGVPAAVGSGRSPLRRGIRRARPL